jgi:hypothetical protein
MYLKELKILGVYFIFLNQRIINMKKVIYAGAGLAVLGILWIKTKLSKKNNLEVIGTFRYPKEVKKSAVIALKDCISIDGKLVYYRKYKPKEDNDLVEKDLVAEDFVINLKEGLVDEIVSLVIEVKDNKYQAILIGYKNGKAELVNGIVRKES